MKNFPFYVLLGLSVPVTVTNEWALAPTTSDRPQTFPAGTLLVPLSSPSARRIDPLWGRCPPLPNGSGSPYEFTSEEELFFKKL